MSVFQVDKTNFSDMYNYIQDILIKSDFVAFDCEFTGLLSCLEKIEGRFPN